MPTISSRESPLQQDNPPMLVLKSNAVKKCYGCKKMFGLRTNRTPYNLIFKMVAIRNDIPDGQGGRRQSYAPQNVYFHLNMRCVRLVYPRVNEAEVEIHTTTFNELTAGHISALEKARLMDIINTKMTRN
jgi:hypothetical protein